MKGLLAIVALAVVAVGVFLFLPTAKSRWSSLGEPRSTIDSFKACAAAGYPIQESYPRRCSVEGKTFTETVVLPDVANLIHVKAPLPDTLVGSPLLIVGEARGNWYFEASFPVRLIDAAGTLLAEAPAQAKSDWMTTEFVPFEVELDFQLPTTETGTLILKKDNPSGLPEHDASVSLPVRFK